MFQLAKHWSQLLRRNCWRTLFPFYFFISMCMFLCWVTEFVRLSVELAWARIMLEMLLMLASLCWLSSRLLCCRMCCKRTASKHAAYYRFKDDIFIIATDGFLFTAFLREMRRRAACFEIELGECSCQAVPFLDAYLCKEGMWAATGRLDVKPHFKPTALQVPLSELSSHPPSVHYWPLADLNRLAKLSCKLEHFYVARQRFIQRFVEFGASPALVRALRRSAPALRSPFKATQSAASSQDVWMAVPYHPIWARASFQSIFDKFLSHPRWLELLQSAWQSFQPFPKGTRLRVAWKLGGHHLAQQLQRL